MPERFHSERLPPLPHPARGRTPTDVLRRIFGFPAFRGVQRMAVDAVMRGEDLLAMMPTGGGKSLAYQVPALCLPGTAIVVSPLVALMRDQCDALRRKGVRAAALVSDRMMPDAERAETEAALAAGSLDLVYVSPERLASRRFLDVARDVPVSLVAVDEAHCICEWGHGFRPDYLTLPDALAALPRRPRIALTASATLAAREEIMWRLLSPEADLVVGGFDRPNIALEVSVERRPLEAFLRILSSRPPGEPAIAYCPSRIEAERTGRALAAEGFAAAAYHAGLDEGERNRTQDAFLGGRVRVMAATSAFGMGIDKPDVGLVGHLGLPSSLEAYYQESGRAGRDGRSALSWVGWSVGQAVSRQVRISDEEDPDTRRRERARLEGILGYVESPSCRRAALLRRFGETYREPCGACDRCLRPPPTRPGGKAVTALLAAVGRMSGDHAPAAVAALLSGQAMPAGMRTGGVPQFGALSELSQPEVLRLFRQCAGAGLVGVDERDGNVRLLADGFRTMRDGIPLALPDASARPPRPALTDAGLPAWRRVLWEELIETLPGTGGDPARGALARRIVAAACDPGGLSHVLSGLAPEVAGRVAAATERLRPAREVPPPDDFDLF